MWQYNYSPDIYHFGIKGMKWGVRKDNYHSTGLRAFMARKQNERVDRSFKEWNENDKKKANAISLGKQANKDRMAWENDRSNSALKKAFKSSNSAYKKALSQNTTYRKGAVREEVGKDLSRKYLSAAKKVKKQLDANPEDKNLKKKYDNLMSQHDIERSKARRAAEVGANRSYEIAALKGMGTMAIKSAAIAGAASVGAKAINYFSGGSIRMAESSVLALASTGAAVMGLRRYIY